MKLNLVYAHQGQSKTITLSTLSVAWFFSLFCLLLATAIIWGSQQYQQLWNEHQQSLVKLEKLQWQTQAQDVEQRFQRSYTQLASKVAQVQAQMLALNSLTDELIAGTELAGEFAQTKHAAVGGALPAFNLAPLGEAQLYSQLSELALQQTQQKKQLHLLESWNLSHHLQQQSYISGWPAQGKGVWLSSPYGKRIDPFSQRQRFHKGVDIAGKEGTEIKAVGAGVVTWAGERLGYGNLVEINHGNGMVTRYAHAKQVSVAEGELVEKGQLIALMGSTGRSTGSHVHFEVLKHGRHVSPNRYIYRKAKQENWISS